MVYTLCYRMLGNAADAQDVMQEVFTKVFLSIRDFEGRSAFSSWLYRIAYNHCLNFLASRGRRATVNLAAAPEPAMKPAPLAERGPLEEMLTRLEPGQRSLLLMKYVMDLDVNQISEVLGITAGAVKMRLLRAREEFRRAYEEKEKR